MHVQPRGGDSCHRELANQQHQHQHQHHVLAPPCLLPTALPGAAALPSLPWCCAVQGGAVVFQGRRLLFAHYDQATAAHVDFGLLLEEATKGL